MKLLAYDNFAGRCQLNLYLSKKQHTIIGLAGTLVIVSIVAILSFDHLAKKSLPISEGSIEIAGLEGPVEIVRDELGVPHIFAGNERDMFFAVGFVQAQDRLWQMDLRRRHAQGRLAEIFGSRAVPSDRIMRTLGLSRLADSLVHNVSEHSLMVLEAYSAGINAWIDASRGEFPVEFDILQYRPEKWEPAHSLLVFRAAALDMESSWQYKLFLADAVHRLGIERTSSLLDPGTAADDDLAEALQSFVPDCAAEFEQGYISPWGLSGDSHTNVGADAWGVNGSKSMSGQPLIAGTLHAALGVPSAFYILHMASPGINAAGIVLPGFPCIITGMNSTIAWAAASLPTNNMELYMERIRYRDSTYEFRGVQRSLRVRVDSIFIRDASPIALSVFETHHGPIINPPFRKAEPARWIAAQSSISLAWTGFFNGDEVGCFTGVNRAASVDECPSALRGMAAPMIGMIVAGRGQDCRLILTGLIPARPRHSPAVPVPGWTGAFDWMGGKPLDLPSAVADSTITLAGNIPEGYPSSTATQLGGGNQQWIRINEILREQHAYKERDIELMQMDIRTTEMSQVRDAMVQALAGMPGRPQELTDVMNRLAQWDMTESSSQPAAAVFNVAAMHCAHETFADEMGPELYKRFQRTCGSMSGLLRRLVSDTATTWFDNAGTPDIETRDNIMRLALVSAVRDLQRLFGRDMNTWQWGRLHRASLTHPLAGRGMPDRFAIQGPFTTGGNAGSVTHSSFNPEHPYEATGGSVARFVMDLAVPDAASIVISTGESGDPLSPHYHDQSAMWLNGVFHRLEINPNKARDERWKRLTLRPRR